MTFKNGDAVQLKVPLQGRYFRGRASKVTKSEVTITLPTGYFVTVDINNVELTTQTTEEREVDIEEEE